MSKFHNDVSPPLANHVTSGVSRNSGNFGTKTDKATTKVILNQPLTKVPLTKTVKLMVPVNEA